jgi:acetolactate synthase-1/2/3 large subunit
MWLVRLVVIFRPSRRRDPAHLCDALSPYEADGPHPPCAGAPRTVRRAHGRRLRPGYGRVGVCIATSGPGATNLVTGLATAQMDSVPIVAITGQVPTNLLGTDAFQESTWSASPQPGLQAQLPGHRRQRTPAHSQRSLLHCPRGRPGVVLVDICKDVQNATGIFRYDYEIDLPGFEPWPNVNMVSAPGGRADQPAERPLILAGHGVQMAGVSRELLEMVEKAEIPVVTTLLGTGNIPESHPLSLGMGGMHGEAYANRAMQGCDVLIAMGMRFDDRITGRLTALPNRPRSSTSNWTGRGGQECRARRGGHRRSGRDAAGAAAHDRGAPPPGLDSGTQGVAGDTQADIINYEVEELIPPFVIRQLWHATKASPTHRRSS